MKKLALITGATRGIGRGILEIFLQNNFRVIGTYNSSDKIAKEIIQLHGEQNVSFIQFSQGDVNSHKELLSKISDNVDVLVNNAGLGSKTVEYVTTDKYEQDLELMKVNSLGPLWLCESFIERMAKQGQGKIINIS